MKSIKDCQWIIEIGKDNIFFWYAFNDKSGLTILRSLYFQTKTGAKNNWKQFAKLNGIKKWRFTQ